MEKIMTLCGTDTASPVMSSGPILALEFLGFYSSAYSKGFKAFYNFVESNYFIDFFYLNVRRVAAVLGNNLKRCAGAKRIRNKSRSTKRFRTFSHIKSLFQFACAENSSRNEEICT